MHFLSSKLVHELETAFSLILNSQRVKQGVILLEKLKRQQNFELGLATFISRSEIYHQRLLAILQLEKQLVIKEQQTAWSLKEVYFKDSDKIAQKICKLITANDNIKYASEFLKLDPSQCGLSTFRQIQIVFNLLRNEDKAFKAIENHSSSLDDYFTSIFQFIQCEDECFYFIITCLALYYWLTIKYHASFIPEQLFIHWNKIKQKCSSCALDESLIIIETIQKMLSKSSTAFKSYAFGSFLKNTFQSISRCNSLKLKYQSKGLEFIIKNNQILSNSQERQAFVEVIRFFNFNKINEMLSNFRAYGEIEIEFNNQLELQDKSETLVFQLCNFLVKIVLTDHYDWLKYDYLPRFTRSIQALQSLLSLTNYSNSVNIIPNIQISSLIAQVFNVLEQQIFIKIQNANQKHLIQLITLIEFLTKSKSYIQISLVPNIVHVLVQKRGLLQALSPFSDAFLSEIWRQLTYMQINELTDFVQLQLRQVNENQWSTTFKSYECFLYLGLYFEQSFNYFSTCNQSDSLLQHYVRSHQIICEMIRENSKIKLNFELFEMLLQLTSFIIQNKSLRRTFSIINRLSIPFLVEQIQKRLLLSEVSAIIISFNHYQSHQIINQVKKESENWSIHELDYQYRIKFYLKCIQYASQSLQQSEIQTMMKELGTKIIEFIKGVPSNELNKFKQTKLWEQLDAIYNIRLFVNIKMQVQSS